MKRTKIVTAGYIPIKSFSPEEKECGATIIARMTDNPQFVTQLIECGGIKVIAPLLVDSNPAVRHTVCGCLRNLSSCSSEVAEEMVKEDVMTPLVSLFKQYTGHWMPTPHSKGKIDSKTQIFIEACNLLSCLCEFSSIIIETFNQNNLISILLPCLNAQVFGLDVVLAVVQCLYTVTENNPDAIENIAQPVREVLHSFVSHTPTQATELQLRILAIGVILNLNFGKITMNEPCPGDIIIRVLDETLDIPIQVDIEKLSEAIVCYKENKKDKYAEPSEVDQKFSELVDYLKKFQSILTAKQNALEILTNICCSDDCDWDETGSSTTSEDLTDSDDASCVPVSIGFNIPCEVHGMLVSKKIVHKVLQQIVIPHEKITLKFQEISEGKTCLKRLHTVRCRALFCINNIVQGLDIEELGGIVELFQLWKDLVVLVFSQTEPNDCEQLQAATSSVRAVLQKLGETNSASHFDMMTENDLKLFFDMCQQCQESAVRVNIVRSVATVGCILADLKQQNAYSLIKVIGMFLTEVCAQSNDLWVTSEALDAIFDVFSEDHLDHIVQEIGLVTKLKVLLPSLKSKVKQQRNALGEHLPVIMTAKTNLLRFLKYKENWYKNMTKC